MSVRIPKEELIGKTYGRLTILELLPCTDWKPKALCICSCGNEKIARVALLRNGHVQSCGCQKTENNKNNHLKKHGLSSRPEYEIWSGMKKRCLNPKCRAYHNYGGRGITVCERWLHSFENFFADMGERPTPQHTLERENNNLGYSPENCSWQTRQVQCNNTRKNKHITLHGRTQTFAQWCREYGQPYALVQNRFAYCGWDFEKALTAPVTPNELCNSTGIVEIDGVSNTLAGWSRHHGICPDVVMHRIKSGWELIRALTTPLIPRPYDYTPRTLTMNGSTKLLTEWAKEYGILPDTLKGRLRRGWSVERAITEPRQS